MISVEKVKELVSGGLAFPCAMCENYWKAAPSNGATPLNKPWKCGTPKCGGPMSGLTFPKYKGQLPDGDWESFCFVCAQPFELVGVIVPGTSRRLALCEKHKIYADRLVPLTAPGEILEHKKIILVSSKVDGVQG